MPEPVDSGPISLARGWEIQAIVDDDGHLNIYVENDDSLNIDEVETGQGGGHGEQLALRFTTPVIEDAGRGT